MSSKIVEAAILSCLAISVFCHAPMREEQRRYDQLNRREDEYRRVMLFLSDPVKHFVQIQDITDPFQYINMAEMERQDLVFSSFLERNFRTANRKRARILIYLSMLRPVGEAGYYLTDKVIKLFESHPRPFLDELKQRDDWIDFIGTLRAGNWLGFIDTINRLRDSGFEGVFKRYVLRTYEGRRDDPA